MLNADQLRETITNQIIEILESGKLPPWRKPWSSDKNSGPHTSLSSGKTYRGINQLLLEMAAMRKNYTCKWWGTYRQIKERNGQVRKGEKGTTVVLYKPVRKGKKDAAGEEKDESFLLMRSFVVFNADQCDGLDKYQVGQDATQVCIEERFEKAETVVEATGADIRYGGDRAFYSRSSDYIQCPHRHKFTLPEFYSTVFHELTHWSESRLDWEGSYAMGELVAEMGACFISSEIGVPQSDNLENHAAYLKSWLSAMRNDPKFIFRASSQASKAADYILSFIRQETLITEDEVVTV